jgi:hypothetical protein
MWCIPQVDGTYVARMENVLDLYAEAADPKHPLVCFDESPTQPIGEVRQPIPAEHDHPPSGIARALRLRISPQRHGQFVRVSRRLQILVACEGDRSPEGVDFAACMRDLVDTHYLHVDRIRIVVDNLPTTLRALWTRHSLRPKRTASCNVWNLLHPKHASWLNLVEIGVLRGQYLARRIGKRCVRSGHQGMADPTKYVQNMY